MDAAERRVKLIDELVRDECRGGKPELKLYWDTKGIPTIGIGRNLLCGISAATAYQMCHEDIDAAEGDLNHAVPWWRQLDEPRQRVLVNMCFNMGIARLLGFHHFLAALQLRDWKQAEAEMKSSKWHKDVGVRSDRLAAIVLTGVSE